MTLFAFQLSCVISRLQLWSESGLYREVVVGMFFNLKCFLFFATKSCELRNRGTRWLNYERFCSTFEFVRCGSFS